MGRMVKGMYKKALVALLLLQFVLVAGYFCLYLSNDGTSHQKKAVYEVKLNQIILAQDENTVLEICVRTNSGQRELTYNILERPVLEDEALISVEDYENLLRIVEAEAGGEDETGKLLVANVVLNRVESESFPDTISEVILQKNKGVAQFSPVGSGRFWKVQISDETISAVNRALSGEDVSQGALYFAARKHADADNMRWFDERLDYLFTHGGHEFFAE